MAEDIEELRVKTGDGAKRPRCQLYPNTGNAPRFPALPRWAITGCEQSLQTVWLLDHLIGAGEQLVRHSAPSTCPPHCARPSSFAGFLVRAHGGQ